MFFFAVLLIAILTAAWVSRPLWLRPSRQELSVRALDRSVYEERRRELDQDLLAEELTAEEHAALLEELARTLLADERQGADAQAAAAAQSRVWGLAVALLLVLLGVGLYAALWFDPALATWWKVEALVGPDVDRVLKGQPPQNNKSYGLPDFVRVLQTRVAADPGRADLWAGLGMSYEQLHAPDIAALAFAHANQLHPGQVGIELPLAQAQLEASDGQLDASTRDLLESLLKQSPQLLPAQLMLAEGSYNVGDYARAIPLYDALLAAPDSGLQGHDRQVLEAHRQDAVARAAADIKNAGQVAKLDVTVAIPASLRAQAAGATLFVFAKAVQGPPMPLAVARYSLSAAPAEVVLDDSMAMMPALRLSNFARVKVSALISRQGQALPQSGDWVSPAVFSSTVGEQHIHLLINQRLP